MQCKSSGAAPIDEASESKLYSRSMSHTSSRAQSRSRGHLPLHFQCKATRDAVAELKSTVSYVLERLQAQARAQCHQLEAQSL